MHTMRFATDKMLLRDQCLMYDNPSHDFLTVTHLPALVAAEHITKGDIIELGCGLGSTPMLNMLSRLKCRRVISYESNME